MGGDPPAVREEEFSIEIDMKKGKWPFLKAIWGRDKDERLRLVFIVDANDKALTMTEGVGIGIVALSRKKAKRLADFIYRTLDEVDE